MASVEIQTPEGVMRVRLDRDHFTIGRLSSNDIALPFPHISRHHAELRRNGETWWVVDAKSTNGLHVGAQRVSESRLTPGAVVMLSPQVALTLLEETAPDYSQPQPHAALPSQPVYPPQLAFTQQPGVYPQQPSAYPQPPAGYPQPPLAYQQQPSAPSYYSAPSQAPAHEQITPLSELGPRSPYADDEAPYYPQMRQRQPTQAIQHPLYPPHGPAAPFPFDRRTPPPAPPRSEPAP
ncbi:MAG: FHA domain-containing protein, partial [Chloroflexota bacterium]|nr:FHA domain-containing protein [Chloroflexota bacterium]